ncbi:hypothetical protein [Erythrobacter sp. R86502]|uniref:hypothetical protein n=1 Tax=Erythrobacter sp. R86502 TaxID=3093846 RepID=UPI0036D2A0D4
MKMGQQGQPKPRKRDKSKTHNRESLVAHRIFAPMMGLWGALLAGLPILVIPAPLFDQMARGTMVDASALPAQPIMAAGAAVILGGAFFALASLANRHKRKRHEPSSVASRAIRSIRPIDPAQDLGSRSLDEPLAAMPFASRADQSPKIELSSPEKAAAPRELDLAAFADLPGRNAVWIEENVAGQGDDSAHGKNESAAQKSGPSPVTSLHARAPQPQPFQPHPGTAALNRLRAVAPSELSLVEMVERFAGALHDHRTTPPAPSMSAADLAAREAALAEALRALAALGGHSEVADTRDPLRNALAQLQTRRGAA